MDPQIDEDIRQNRDRDTREAMRQQLTAAGHDPAAVDAAWERVEASSTRPAPRPLVVTGTCYSPLFTR